MTEIEIETTKCQDSLVHLILFLHSLFHFYLLLYFSAFFVCLIDNVLIIREKVEHHIHSTQVKINALQLGYEYEHKRMEEAVRRYQKADCIEVVPKEFLLSEEINGYISEEGCLLFLIERLSLADCRNLRAYKMQINKSRGNLKSKKTHLVSGIFCSSVLLCYLLLSRKSYQDWNQHTLKYHV